MSNSSGDRVHAIRERRIRRTGQHVRLARNLYDIRRLTAAGPLRVKCVPDRVRPSMAAIVSSTYPDSLSVSVWMLTCTSYSSATSRARRRTACVVPQSSWHLNPVARSQNLFDERSLARGVTLPEDAHVDRQGLKGAEHHLQVPRARRDGCAVGPIAGSDSTAPERGDAVAERRFNLLRADHVDVTVDPARSQDEMLGTDGIRLPDPQPGRG